MIVDGSNRCDALELSEHYRRSPANIMINSRHSQDRRTVVWRSAPARNVWKSVFPEAWRDSHRGRSFRGCTRDTCSRQCPRISLHGLPANPVSIFSTQRRFRWQFAGTLGSGYLSRLTVTAGKTFCSSTVQTGGHKKSATLRLYHNNGNGTTVSARAGLDMNSGMGWRRRLQQRRFRHSRHRRRPEPALPQHGRDIRRRHQRRGLASAKVSALPLCGLITIATAFSISSSATTSNGLWKPTSSAA
jgi:hypothetical protein